MKNKKPKSVIQVKTNKYCHLIAKGNLEGSLAGKDTDFPVSTNSGEPASTKWAA